ncbi:MAG: hypothetical protein HeimC3_33640 [Candidatus Heimdallarchaeota archaeon LC_3]|nr:MAG: hypothetical protein HeimC3_33640 [Candidatus Heimdallarchaeota archaeon LC_3]
MIEPLFSSLIALFVAFLWGINSHFVKKGMIGENVFSSLFFRSITAFPILIILGIYFSGLDVLLNYLSLDVFPFVFASIILLVIGDGIFAYSLKKYPVKVILPITSIYPLFTQIVLMITGQEFIGTSILFGTVIIDVGVFMVTRGDSKNNIKAEAVIFGLIPAIAWGTSVAFVNYVLNSLPGAEPISLTGIRILFIGVIGLGLFFLSKNNVKKYIERPREEKINSIFYLGLSGLIAWTFGATLFFFAVQNIGAGIPTPISSTNPIWAVLVGTLFGIEFITRKQMLGVFSCVMGTIIILL